MKRVVMVLSNSYRPDARVEKEINSLLSKGYKVKLIAWDRECSNDDLFESKNDDFEIVRVKEKSVYGTGIKQIVPYVKFVFQLRKILKVSRFDIVHAHDLDGVLATTLAMRKKKLKTLLFDMHEIYEYRTNKKLLKYIFRFFVNRMEKKSDVVFYVNEAQKKLSKEKYRDKMVYLPNYPIVNESLNTKINNENGKFVVSYIGDLRHKNEISYLISELSDLKDVVINIHGKGTAYELFKEQSETFDNVNVTGVFKYSEISELYANTDILYAVHNINTQQGKVLVPTKYFEAIEHNVPQIVPSDCDLGNIVTEQNIGFTVDILHQGELRTLVEKIIKNGIDENKLISLSKIKGNYNWNKCEETLLSEYERI